VVQRAPRSAGTEPGLAPEGAKAPPAPPTLLAAPGTVIYPPRVAGSVQSLRSPAGPAGAD
jgi:hypothetical protein